MGRQDLHTKTSSSDPLKLGEDGSSQTAMIYFQRTMDIHELHSYILRILSFMLQDLQNGFQIFFLSMSFQSDLNGTHYSPRFPLTLIYNYTSHDL